MPGAQIEKAPFGGFLNVHVKCVPYLTVIFCNESPNCFPLALLLSSLNRNRKSLTESAFRSASSYEMLPFFMQIEQ